VAQHGDGWNVPFVAPDALARKRQVLAEHCAALGRDPADLQLAVNVAFCDDDASLAAQFGPRAEAVGSGAVVGTSVDQAVDALGRYLDAGADQVHVALRAPWDHDALDRAAVAVAAVR
jgi:alkanesulfonate monooxygenase SsuD/methylene tetrahydromethanopterin reductase-like flavin-dependent oxidoreductase (luciferase family)